MNERTLPFLEERTCALLLMRRLFEAPLDRAFADMLSDCGAATVLLELCDDAIVAHAADELTQPMSADALERAEADYTKLFVGPGAPAAPFWESVYLDDREVLFLPSTSEVRRIYESEGLAVNATTGREAEDSLPHQLDFLATLSQRAFDAMNRGDIAEAVRLASVSSSFEAAHMLSWLDTFAERAEHAEVGSLYPDLCHAVAAFIRADAEHLENCISPSE